MPHSSMRFAVAALLMAYLLGVFAPTATLARACATGVRFACNSMIENSRSCANRMFANMTGKACGPDCGKCGALCTLSVLQGCDGTARSCLKACIHDPMYVCPINATSAAALDAAGERPATAPSASVRANVRGKPPIPRSQAPRIGCPRLIRAEAYALSMYTERCYDSGAWPPRRKPRQASRNDVAAGQGRVDAPLSTEVGRRLLYFYDGYIFYDYNTPSRGACLSACAMYWDVLPLDQPNLNQCNANCPAAPMP